MYRCQVFMAKYSKWIHMFEAAHEYFLSNITNITSREDAENRIVHNSSWRRRFNSCWVLALNLTMLTHFTPPPASWFQSYPTLSWFLCSQRCITQHKLTDNLKQNERCVICQQTASHQSRDSQFRESTEILSLQHPALFQHLLFACFLTILLRFMSISVLSACRWKIT